MTPPLTVQVVTHGTYPIKVSAVGVHTVVHAPTHVSGPAVEVWSRAKTDRRRRKNMGRMNEMNI